MEKTLINQFIEALIKLNRTQTQECVSNTSKGEIAVLVFLVSEKNKVSAGYLSKNLNVSSGRMADTLNALEHKKLITRQSDKEDKRRTIVSYTKKGKDYMMSRYQEMYSYVSKLFKKLGSNDSKELIRIINKITDISFKEEVSK